MERNPLVIDHQRERGTAVFLALFALLAVSYASLQLVRHAASYAQLLRTYRDGLEHHNTVRAGISPIVSQTRRCELQTLLGGSISGAAPHPTQWYVCTLGSPPFLSNHHLSVPALNPDYNALFVAASQCPGTRAPTSRTTFDTPHAANTCTLPGRLETGLVVTDNIAVETVVVTHTDSLRPTTMATPGSFTVAKSLSISGDTLIVAGGDIAIPLLTLHSGSTTRVSVVSAHGDIVIGQIEGPLTLTALGRRALSVPPGAVSNPPLLPPSRGASIAGFIGG